MGRLLQLLGSCVQFSYACWDRIVLRGYYPRLQRPANLVYLFRDVGARRASRRLCWRDGRRTTARGWRDRRSSTGSPSCRHRRASARRTSSRRTTAPSGASRAWSSSSRAWSRAPPSSPMNPPRPAERRRLPDHQARRQALPPLLLLHPGSGHGPDEPVVGSYLPFTVSCFLNGHSYVAQELRRAGVRFRMEDNAILACADPDALTAVATASTSGFSNSAPATGPLAWRRDSAPANGPRASSSTSGRSLRSSSPAT